MGIFGSASGAQIDQFAKALARELAERAPPQPGENAAKNAGRKLISALESVSVKARGFNEQHKLGVYKKARLGNSFRWELLALGYEKSFAEEATQQLIVRLAS